ncbi:SDR family oxidoreductase [Microbacterium sp. A196]|uniref:SDR family oxidoreductase n=1 Tax=unclassified Microbacterium TaxID=2609290 RepID=UPI003FD498E4
MTSFDQLHGRVAFITGAGSGIGEGLARYTALQVGMHAVVADVDERRAAEIASDITAQGGKATALQVDVSNWDSVAAAAERALESLGVPAFVACNAGIEQTGLAWETSPADWARVEAVNVNGAFYTMRAFTPAMIENGASGHILFTSSIGGISIGASQASYTVSKHAVRVLAQSLQADLDSISSPLQVSILLPGPVRTRIFVDALSTGDVAAEAFRERLATLLAEEGLTADEVAELTLKAIAQGRRWIYPHPTQARDVLTAHTAELLAGVNS